MWIIGCDVNPGFQQVLCLTTGAGSCVEQRLGRRAEGEQRYRLLIGPVRLGETKA
jgi:hypothetical protein